MIETRRVSPFGSMLRKWRRIRGRSQLDLALSCGVSQRHLSFLETGRSDPSRGMILLLASGLDVPLREQNLMLLAAGFAPLYRERPLDSPEMEPVLNVVTHALAQHDPFPAILVDGAYNILRANDGLALLLGVLLGPEAARAAAQQPMNAAEIVLRPDGLRPFIENWRDVGGWLIRRLRAENALEGEEGLIGQVLERVLRYPDVAALERAVPVHAELPPVLPLRFRRGDVRLSLFSMIATVGTPLDASLQDLRLELFYPADEETTAAIWTFSGRSRPARRSGGVDPVPRQAAASPIGRPDARGKASE